MVIWLIKYNNIFVLVSECHYLSFDTDFLKNLVGDDGSNPTLVELHLLDGPHVARGFHPTQAWVAVLHKATLLLFHVLQ